MLPSLLSQPQAEPKCTKSDGRFHGHNQNATHGKSEYDELIRKEYICRIAFGGESHPYIAPFLYVFDGKFIYFLSTKYGRKIEQFRRNPLVTVEVEKYSPDLSNFSFVAIPGRLTEVEDQEIKRNVREMFVKLIKTRGLSPNILSALGLA